MSYKLNNILLELTDKQPNKKWSIKSVSSLEFMETELNELQGMGYSIQEVNTKDLIIIYYKDIPTRIDD
tara:strand:- start:807 stop:1013 length:207 start_codon:yes stop_codon:yes gene_type:complete